MDVYDSYILNLNFFYQPKVKCTCRPLHAKPPSFVVEIQPFCCKSSTLLLQKLNLFVAKA